MSNQKVKMYCIGVWSILTSILFLSCQEEKIDKKSEKIDSNIAIALAKQGFLIENNELSIDEKVKTTLSLDLSRSNISNLNGLEHFTALEELNLSDNELSVMENDLFQKIKDAGIRLKRLTLKSNPLISLDIEYLSSLEYLDVSESENLTLIKGLNSTVHSNLMKLKLPYSLRDNRDVIYKFYQDKSAKTEIQIEDKSGKMIEYNSLREIPDEVFRAFLLKKYPEVFTNEKYFDLSKTFDIDEKTKPEKHNWTNAPFAFDPRYFDAKGIKSFEGIQYFKHLIKIWYAHNLEVEHIDLSNAVMLEELSVGSNRASYYDHSTVPNEILKTFNIQGCSKIKNLIVDGLTSTIDLSTLTSLEDFSFNIHVSELDFSNCSKIQAIHLNRHYESIDQIARINKITFPKSNDWSGLKLLSLPQSEISSIDFSAMKANDYFGVILILEKCMNLKSIKINHKLGTSSSLRDGAFEDIDLRGAQMWNSNQMQWIDASETSSIYSGNTQLKELNGKPYSSESKNKKFVVNATNFKQWTYLYLDENDELKIRGIDTYPTESVEEKGKDEEWKERIDWDFSIHYNDLRTNSGTSGIGNCGIVKLSDKDIDAISTQIASTLSFEQDISNQKMILSLSSMPPPSTNVAMSIYKSFSMSGMPPTFISTPEVFVIKTVKNKYILIKFLDFYDSDRTQGFVKIEYKVI